MPVGQRLGESMNHNCDTWLIEVALIENDENGCKVMQCEKCSKEYDSHRKIYGCKNEAAI